MILRRVMQHVRDQNWFAVGLDFAIVVFGVFIGFQLTEWNEAREARASEAGYLRSVDRDLAESAAMLESHQALVAARMDALAGLATAASEDIGGGDFTERVRLGLFELDALNVQRTTFDALEGAGLIDRLGAVELQRRLFDQGAAIERIRFFEADMERFQHRWVDEFLLARMTMTDLVAIPGAAPTEAAAAAPSDGPRLRNLAAFLYEILRAQNGELSELGDSYADARALIAARLEEIGADGPA